MDRKIRTTHDGSTTIYDENFGEHFHSIFGAEQESIHVFIKNGFYVFNKKSLNILEMGFGTGLNALLTILACEASNRKVFYHTFDMYPIDNFEIIEQLSFSCLNTDLNKKLFLQIHQAPWNETCKVTKNFSLLKENISFIDAQFTLNYDLVYYDAFSPEKQPELWNFEIFRKIFDSLHPGGILTTYCAKGEVKRTLNKVGFEVKLLPGPPGKRHMICAIKKS